MKNDRQGIQSNAAGYGSATFFCASNTEPV
jgi:hypothetical protein